jgi:hypothetical protein
MYPAVMTLVMSGLHMREPKIDVDAVVWLGPGLME